MGIKRLRVNMTDEPPYDVRIGNGASANLAEVVGKLVDPHQIALIVDENVGATAGSDIHGILSAAGYMVCDLMVPSGEGAKTLEVAGELYEALSQLRFSRDDLIIAVGGGVVGDLAGFVASTYLRGLPLIQVPTTLLSMVDASVGGKTGLNLPQGRNLVGTFAQPVHVTADTRYLDTLPEREWHCGMGEVAKTAMVGPESLYNWLQTNIEALSAHEEEAVLDAIVQCVAYKADVVIHDEREQNGLRERLNYGHTFAHALEHVAGYGTYSHGQAVAEGMRFAIRLAVELLDTPPDLVDEQDAMLDLLMLDPIHESYDPRQLLEAMHNDKKARAGRIRFVLPESRGEMIAGVVEDETVLRHLEAWSRR